MIRNFIVAALVCSISFICSPLYSQTGPGGVGDNTSNILWLRADDISGLANGENITTWIDNSGNDADAVQADTTKSPDYAESVAELNGLPALYFDGNNDCLDFSAVTHSASNYDIFLIYKSDVTSSAHTLDIQTGRLILGHERGAARAYNVGGNWRGTEVQGTSSILVNYKLDDAGADVIINGLIQDTAQAYTQRAIGGNRKIGSAHNESGQFFEGYISEVIFYNTILNSAQRRILENYLGNKYNLSIPNNDYAYQASYGHDLAGIGRVDASNQHTAAQSAHILHIGSASDLGDGEFLFFGHDGGSFTSWTDSETPGSSLQRIATEWRLDETGDIGTVTISLDTTQLAAKPSGYTKYVLWVDADGDFSSGATQYVLSYNNGFYEATGIDVSKGDYITFGMLKPEIQFTTASAFGSEATTPVTVEVSLNYAVDANTTVNYTVNDGLSTATEGVGNDFERSDSTVTIAAGSTTTSFNIAINDDGDDESDETIVIDLSSPTNGASLGANSTYTYTINDNDAIRNIEFASATGNGSEATTTVYVTIQLDLADADDTTKVDYAVTGGTATGGGTDYTLSSGTAVLEPNNTDTTITIIINNDNLYENDETIIITLSNPSANANVGTNNTFTYTINDNDNPPLIDFTNVNGNGSEGTASVNIQVTLSQLSGVDAEVDYVVTGGTATGGGVDYTLSNGTLTIPAGSMTTNIALTVEDDDEIEPDETIIITIRDPLHATLTADSVYTFTINDNDNMGSTGPGGVGDNSSNILWLRADNITGVANGEDITTWSDNSGNINDMSQSVDLNKPHWNESNTNFKNQPTVTFDGANHFFDASVLTHGDSDYDIFFVYRSTVTTNQRLYHAANGSLIIPHEGGTNGAFRADANIGTEITGTGTQMVEWRLDNAGADIYINGTNDQTGLTYTQQPLGGNRKLGSNSGGTGNYFNGNIGEAIFFNKPLTSAQRKIVENYLGAKYGLTIANDLYSHDATYGHDVAGIGKEGATDLHTSATSAGILNVSTASNLDNGEYLLFGHDNTSIAEWTTNEVEGDSIQRVAREWRIDETGDVGTVTFRLDTAYLTEKPSGYTKYILWVDGDGNFASTATPYVMVYNNGYYEATGVNISDGDFVTFGILKPVIQFTTSAANGLETISPVTVEISINYALNENVSVDYTINGSSTATQGGGNDYILSNGTATITAGNTTTGFNITINDDSEQESDETIVMDLSNPTSGITIGNNSTYTYTINDDDADRSIQFTIDSTGGSEATTSVTVYIELDVVDNGDTTMVDYSVTGGTATGGGTDYTLAAGTAVLEPGNTDTSFTFSINNDNLHEASETIIITLSNPTPNTNIGTNSSFTYTIVDNDPEPEIKFTTTTSNGTESASSVNIEVSLAQLSGKNAQVDYTVTGGTATGSGTDYTLADGTLTITAGNISNNITLSVTDDDIIEPSETVVITLRDPVGATLATDSVHTYTINDNDNLGSTGPGGVGDYNSNILWIRAGDITGVANGGNISTWVDTSGNNHDLTATGTEPDWNESNADFNNHPSVNFDGATEYFNAAAVNSSATDYDFFFVYKSTATSRQHLFHSQTGALRIAHEGAGTDGAFYDGTARGTEITGLAAQMVEWQLDDAGANIYINGTADQTGLTYVQRAIGGNTKVGANQAGTNQYLNGDIAEGIIYNKVLSVTQRKIVENYLGAKYGLSIANDLYSYEGTYGNDLAGIGQEGATDLHTSATSAGILNISTASNLDNGEYLLFGHDNASIDAWTTSEVEGDSIQRIAREWRLAETGDVGTVTIALDTSYLPSKPSGYTKYVAWVDADGDFSSTAQRYVMVLNGGQYKATGVNISNGNFITFGVLKPVINFTTTTGSGSETTSPVNVQITLNYPLTENVQVDYVVNDGSSTATEGGGNDFVLADGTATVVAGNTTTSFDITITDDSEQESDETIVIDLANPSNGLTIGANSTYTYTINDDDANRNVQFLTDSTGGPESTTSVVVTIELDVVDLSDTTKVDYSVTGGTATGGGTDFTLASGTAVLEPGNMDTTFTITINNDDLYENNETIIITLSNSSSNCNIGANSTFTYTIVDDDEPPYIGFSSSVSNGSEGTSSVGLEVTLSELSGKNAQVDYTVTGGTATGNGTDYTLADGTLTITAGNLTQNIAFTVEDDDIVEPDETIIVTLRTPTDATLNADSVHTYTILDDDNLGSEGPGGIGDNGSNILWLRAGDITGVGDGNDIPLWTDVSGNNLDLVQGTPGNQPNWDAADGNFNGHSSITFNGTSDFFDASALTSAASDYDIFMVYRTASTVRQWMFHTPSGTLIIPHEGAANEGAFSDGTARGTEITGTATQLVEWQLDDAGSNIYINGATNQTGLDYVQRAISGSSSLGANSAGTNRYFNGDLAEVIMFNKVLNKVQRYMVENYLGAKYGLSIANDRYAYQAAHGHDVAGIGNEGGSDVHTSATSAGILNISNASALDSAEYLLFGHNNGSINSWVDTEIPNAEVERISREWRLDETGNVGSITVTLDTSLLPARNAGFNGYVLMVDADGDFSSGAILYELVHESGSLFKADNVLTNDGNYITFGSARFLTKNTGNFNNASIWYAGTVPGSGDVAVIDGATVTLTSNQTVGRVEITSGSTLNLNSFTLTIDDSTIINNGNFNAGTGNVDYSRSGNQDVAALSYYNLSLTGSGIKTMMDDIIVNGNLTITGATLDVNANYSVTLNGNWINTTGAFESGNGTVFFTGTSDQEITSNGQDFYNVTINNSGTEITLNDRMMVANLLTLTDGVVTTDGDTIEITNDAASSITGYSSASFINGHLQRAIASNTSTYAFPIGNGTEATNYYLAEIINDGLTLTSYIVASFDPLQNHEDGDMNASDTTQSYNSINTAGVWTLQPDLQPGEGTYDLRLHITNMSGFEDNKFGILKRPVGTDGIAWTAGGGHLSAENGPGRLVSHGYMLRMALNSFSEFGGGGGDGGGQGLPIELISFTAIPKDNVVQLYWITATETNNDFFTLEKSKDGNEFEEMAIIAGAGNSSETLHYSYTDHDPYQEITYYRLKQTDYDGTFEYSNIITVFVVEDLNATIKLFPNPISTSSLFVEFTETAGINKAELQIIDSKGTIVYNQAYDLKGENALLKINLPGNISQGIYHVNLKTADQTISETLVVQ